jgi:hypothetical protein
LVLVHGTASSSLPIGDVATGLIRRSKTSLPIAHLDSGHSRTGPEADR